jgi:hypothetical protein
MAIRLPSSDLQPLEILPASSQLEFDAADQSTWPEILQLEIVNGDEFRDLMKKNVEWGILNRILPELKTIASELFPGEVEIEFESDPEIEDCHYVIFNVLTSGDQADVPSLQIEWYRRTADLLKGNCDKVRLAMSIRQ